MTSLERSTLCEGRLPKAHFGWTLHSGYVKKTSGNGVRTSNQKADALLRAVYLSQRATGSAGASTFSALDLSFPQGEAPAVIVGANRSAAAAASYPVLSLAHSSDLLLAAAGTATMPPRPAEAGLVLGVDVEQLKIRDFARIEAHMGWREASSLRPQGERQMPANLLFYRRWTLAESLYKALGKVNHECFAVLEHLAFGEGWDSGWCSAVAIERHWSVRWWCVRTRGQPAVVCLLRGIQC